MFAPGHLSSCLTRGPQSWDRTAMGLGGTTVGCQNSTWDHPEAFSLFEEKSGVQSHFPAAPPCLPHLSSKAHIRFPGKRLPREQRVPVPPPRPAVQSPGACAVALVQCRGRLGACAFAAGGSRCNVASAFFSPPASSPLPPRSSWWLIHFLVLTCPRQNGGPYAP